MTKLTTSALIAFVTIATLAEQPQIEPSGFTIVQARMVASDTNTTRGRYVEATLEIDDYLLPTNSSTYVKQIKVWIEPQERTTTSSSTLILALTPNTTDGHGEKFNLVCSSFKIASIVAQSVLKAYATTNKITDSHL